MLYFKHNLISFHYKKILWRYDRNSLTESHEMKQIILTEMVGNIKLGTRPSSK